MTDGETSSGQQFSRWLKRQIDLRGVRTTDVIRAGVEAKAFSKVTFYRWYNAEHTPNSDNAKFLAEYFGADPREAYAAAGLTHLMDMEGDIVTAADPVEVFVARVRARGFDKKTESDLIQFVRAEIEERTRSIDRVLDAVQDAQKAAVERGDAPD